MERYGQGSPYLRIRGILSTPEWKAAWNILTRPDLESHIYIPGVGYVNGLQSGNFVESTGSTAGAVDTEVGLVLDAAGSVGAELSPYAAGFVSLTGVSGVGATVSLSSGEVVVTSTSADGADRGEFQVSGLTVGSRYRVTIVARRGAQGNQQGIRTSSAFDIPTTAITSTTSETFTYNCLATAVSGVIRVYSADASSVVGDSVVVTSISIREVTGTHAAQSTTSNKPILRRVPKLLGPELVQNGTFDSNTTGWAAISGGSLSSVSGRARLTVPASNADRAAGQGFQTVAGKDYQASAVINKGTASYALLRVTSESNGGASQFFINSAQINSTTDQAASLTFAGTGGVLYPALAAVGSAVGQYAEFDNVSVREVLEWTYVWQFDGSNDVLALPNPQFQLADDHCVIVAVNPQLSKTQTLFGQRSSAASPPAVLLWLLSSGGVQVLYRNDANSQFTATAPDFSCVVGTPFVASTLSRVGTGFVRANGGAWGSVSKPSGACTLNTCTIGADQTIGLQNAANVLIYAAIIIKGTVSDAELRVLEVAVASTAGVTIP